MTLNYTIISKLPADVDHMLDNKRVAEAVGDMYSAAGGLVLSMVLALLAVCSGMTEICESRCPAGGSPASHWAALPGVDALGVSPWTMTRSWTT